MVRRFLMETKFIIIIGCLVVIGFMLLSNVAAI